MEHRVKIIGVALLSTCVAFGSEALTLGRARGAVLIGQPLDVLVPVQMDAGEAASSLCFEADVFHADTRQDVNRVRVVVEAATQPRMANLRVLSSVLVDEPVVTVDLRTGCGQKTSRRYVLLADLPNEVAASQATLAVSAIAPVSALALTPAKMDLGTKSLVSTAKATAAQLAKQPVRREAGNKRTEAKASVAAPKRARADEKNKVVPTAGQSRLKLDSLELLSDRIANLDSFMTFAPPEDALRSIQKVQALEGDVKALRALAAKSDASLLELRGRLQSAEAERFPGWVIYGLTALVLACLAALALLWSRLHRPQASDDGWWHGAMAAPVPASSAINSVPPLAPLVASQQPDKAPLSRFFNDTGSSFGVDVNLTEMSDSNFNAFKPSGSVEGPERKPSKLLPSLTPAGYMHNFNSEAVFDIRQQAEFFVSLGQTDQAVRILERQIDESDEPNPFVYLDLLSIFHALSLKFDFQQLREEFNRLFGARVPEFVLFKNEGRSLASYPDVLAHITALWPAPLVLGAIEACIFSDPQDVRRQPFDLAAFRDLLLLHAIAHSVIFAAPSEGDNVMAADRTAPASLGIALGEMSRPDMLDLDLSRSDMGGLGSRR